MTKNVTQKQRKRSQNKDNKKRSILYGSSVFFVVGVFLQEVDGKPYKTLVLDGGQQHFTKGERRSSENAF